MTAKFIVCLEQSVANIDTFSTKFLITKSTPKKWKESLEKARDKLQDDRDIDSAMMFILAMHNDGKKVNAIVQQVYKEMMDTSDAFIKTSAIDFKHSRTWPDTRLDCPDDA